LDRYDFVILVYTEELTVKGKVQLFIVITLFCGLVCGCASDEALKKDIASLNSQMVEMQKSIADTNLRMEEMSNSIFILQEQAKANKEQLKAMQQPKIYIQGETSAENHLDPSQSVDPAPLPQGGIPMPGYGAQNIQGGVSSSLPVNASLPGENSEFTSALASYRKNNYGLAVFDFSSFLTKNPNGAEAEQALYYLGMSYFKLNEFAQAVREWNKLLTRFPASSKGAEVAYRIGISYNALGDENHAKSFFDLVIEKYPGTEWAGKAKSALK
jgi:tol-pal system protein YbgF